MHESNAVILGFALAVALVGGGWAAYRYGWPAAGAVVAAVGSLVALLWRRVGFPPPVQTTEGRAEAERQARQSIEDRRASGAALIRDARRAEEAARRLAVDVEALGDAEALAKHLRDRSEGRA